MGTSGWLSSERINSFPSTKRASVNKLMTENSITRLINRLIDKDGYVITNGITDITNTNNELSYFQGDIPIANWIDHDFEFVIRGYYFCISPDDSTTSGLQYLLNKMGWNPTGTNEHTLYAKIFVTQNGEYPELEGQDDESGFAKFVKFYIDEDTDENPALMDGDTHKVYTLELVKYTTKQSGAFDSYVPLSSLFKFDSRSIDNIDGGEIIL